MAVFFIYRLVGKTFKRRADGKLFLPTFSKEKVILLLSAFCLVLCAYKFRIFKQNSNFCNLALISRKNSIERNFECFWTLCVFFFVGKMLHFFKRGLVCLCLLRRSLRNFCKNCFKFIKKIVSL